MGVAADFGLPHYGLRAATGAREWPQPSVDGRSEGVGISRWSVRRRAAVVGPLQGAGSRICRQGVDNRGEIYAMKQTRRTMTKATLSERQSKILEFIGKFIAARGFPPSVRDIQDGLKVSSTSVVDYNLKILEERGLIRRGKGISRAIELIEDENTRANRERPRNITIRLSPVPIAAGLPIPVLGEVMSSSEAEQFDISSMVLGRYAAHPEN